MHRSRRPAVVRGSHVATMARSNSSVTGGALRTAVRFAHSFLYSFSMPRACCVPGFFSSGIQVRTADMAALMAFGARPSSMRWATYSMYVALVHGRATRPCSAHQEANLLRCER